MSEQVTQTGIAFKIPSKTWEDVKEFLEHEFPEVKPMIVDCDEDGKIQNLYTDNKNYDIIQGDGTFYLLNFSSHNTDDCFLEYTVSPEGFLEIEEKYIDYDYRFFAVSWYNGGDAPYVNWNW